MNGVFISVLNMSATASFVAAVVILARLLLKKAPKIFSYALWAVVLFRMICPFSFESIVSILPTNPEPIPQDIVAQAVPRIDSGITFVDNAVNNTIQPATPVIHEALSSRKPFHAERTIFQTVIMIGSYVWLSGIIILTGYAVISYIKIKRRIFAATLAGNSADIFETDQIKTPFVIGFIKPRIYIPAGLEITETDYIIMHEKTHIKRGDHLIKVLAFIALSVHWFNPVMWLSYFLMAKDMEMSCDESVIKKSGEDIRANYSNSLLSLSAKQSGLPNPLAFGESNVKSRIKNVLNFRKRSRLIIALAAILAVAVIIGCSANRANSGSPVSDDENNGFVKKTYEIDSFTISVELPREISGDTYITGSGELFHDYHMSNATQYGEAEKMILIANNNAHVIGTVSLVDFENIPEEQFDYYKESHSFRALYSQFPMGSMVMWGDEYQVVYESEDQREGTATVLSYYRSDYLETFGVKDFSRFKEEIIEGDPRINLYNRGILGYNLDLNKFAVIELYYDAVTDEELQHIAETLRIYGEPNGNIKDDSQPVITEYAGRVIEFNISIQPEQYNNNPFEDGRIINAVMRSQEEVQTYFTYEAYAFTAMTGTGEEGMYLRQFDVDYNDEYFTEHALIAVTFDLSIPKNIYSLVENGGSLTVWARSFEEAEDKSNATRMFLIEVNKSDVEGIDEVYPGLDFAPVVIIEE